MIIFRETKSFNILCITINIEIPENINWTDKDIKITFNSRTQETNFAQNP